MVLTQNKNKQFIIAIDGPAGAGKSSVAKSLAKRLNIFYLDSGAMYRALTWKAVKENVNLEDEAALAALAKRTKIDLNDTPSGLKVTVDGTDVSEAIRTVEITNKTFYAARAPKVREIMVEWQRKIGGERSVVVEGRDIGTVVFPQAAYKFYLDADLEERAHRRIKELKERGQVVDEAKLSKEIYERDQKDMTRSAGPLKQAADAIFIDSTGLTVEGTAEKILQYIK